MNKVNCSTKKIFFLLIIFCALNFFSHFELNAVVIGSKSVASSQAFIIYPSVDTNNSLVGYARFESGFMLADATTSCSYDGYMPVSGTIHLNKGRLTFKRDMILCNVATFLSAGRIEGNSFALELPKQLNDFNLPEIDGLTLNITTSLHLGIDSVLPDARSIDWAMNDDYLALGIRSVPARELRIAYFSGTTLTVTVDAEIGREVVTVRWHPTKRYLAAGLVNGGGNELIIYEHKVHNGTLATLSGATNSGDVRACAWHPSGNYLVIGTTDNSTKLLSYSVNSSGVLGSSSTPATLPSQNISREALSFSPGGNQIVIGTENDTGTNKSELYVYSFNGSLTLTTSLDIGTQILSVDWNPTGTYIAAGLNSGTSNVRIYEILAGQLREVTSARVNESYSVYSVHWDKTGTYLAVATEDKSLENSELSIYYFNKQTKTLALVYSAKSYDEIFVVRWSHNASYIAHGSQPISTSSPHFVFVEGFSSDTNPIFLKDTVLVCNSDVRLKAPLHLIGNCKINGRGKRLIFQSNSGFVVRPGASLLLEDIQLQNMYPSSLRCLDDTGTITLSHCSLHLANDYTFSRGSILFKEDVVISGTNKFAYTTRLTSTIEAFSKLFLNNNVTFSYAPLRANQTLISMNDITSQLFLDTCTLFSTRTGLTLSRGTVVIDNNVTVSSEAKYDAEGIRLSSDLNVVIRGAAVLKCFGRVRYD